MLEERWPPLAANAMLCINMIHIAPWAATLGLLEHAADLLPSGAPLVLYGPYRRDGRHTAPSNEAFDASLRARNPEWGVRDVGEVASVAAGLSFEAWARWSAMPANNFTVALRRAT